MAETVIPFLLSQHFDVFLTFTERITGLDEIEGDGGIDLRLARWLTFMVVGLPTELVELPLLIAWDRFELSLFWSVLNVEKSSIDIMDSSPSMDRLLLDGERVLLGLTGDKSIECLLETRDGV
mmetsp:Transcript_53955/g.131025  ORF Transcript_53955/g.131025 Transcript_53955/m.131025 type:complete len:123 (+) Transcript_53955:1280-1648(+)